MLEEINGNVLRHTTAAFRLIPYIQRENLEEIVQEQEAAKVVGKLLVFIVGVGE